jgi:GTP cyclohydrolase I
MKKDIDYNHIAAVERAIAQKYGEEATRNPASYWTPEKEKEYLKQLKKVVDQDNINKVSTESGFLLDEKLVNISKISSCSKCSSRITTLNDKVYFSKLNVCEKCFILYYEGR